jgi:hypothetical protein
VIPTPSLHPVIYPDSFMHTSVLPGYILEGRSSRMKSIHAYREMGWGVLVGKSEFRDRRGNKHSVLCVRSLSLQAVELW